MWCCAERWLLITCLVGAGYCRGISGDKDLLERELKRKHGNTRIELNVCFLKEKAKRFSLLAYYFAQLLARCDASFHFLLVRNCHCFENQYKTNTWLTGTVPLFTVLLPSDSYRSTVLLLRCWTFLNLRFLDSSPLSPRAVVHAYTFYSSSVSTTVNRSASHTAYLIHGLPVVPLAAGLPRRPHAVNRTAHQSCRFPQVTLYVLASLAAGATRNIGHYIFI